MGSWLFFYVMIVKEFQLESDEMITTVTFNAAVDKTYFLDQWKKNDVSRVRRVLSEPGGKGINVAKVVKDLGGQAVATGFVAGFNGQFIRSKLDEMEIPHQFLDVEGESRLCLNMMDASDGTSTELLEPGPTVTQENLDSMKKHLLQAVQNSQIIVLSGSLPAGVSADAYADIIGEIKATGTKVFLDTSGEALRNGVKAVPDFIKPNETEIAQLIGEEITEHTGDLHERLLVHAHEIAGRGIENVCITLGGDGAVAVINGSGYRVKTPKITPVNTVGCGDAFVAGFAYAKEKGEAPEDCLRVAAAASVANAMERAAGSVKKENFESFLKEVQIEQVQR